MNKIFIVGLFGGIGSLIYYYLYIKKIKHCNDLDSIDVNTDYNKSDNVKKTHNIKKTNICENNIIEPLKNNMIEPLKNNIINPLKNNMIEPFITIYNNNNNIFNKIKFNNNIKENSVKPIKSDKLIKYKKPIPIYELYLKNDWEIL